MSRRAIRRPPPLSFVIAIGQRVFVNCRTGVAQSVLLGDEGGKVMSTSSLADGVEVEVIAWRPRGPTDTRYRVRAIGGDRADGWLFAQSLRRTLIPPVEAVASPPTPPVAAGRPARSVPVNAIGRRFGQHF
jgi:hypothetical protein